MRQIFFVRKIFIPENAVHLTHKDIELSESPPAAGTGTAPRAAGHACTAANITEMSEATQTRQTALGAQGWRASSFFWENSSKVLGQAALYTTAGEIDSGWRRHIHCSRATCRPRIGLTWPLRTPWRRGLPRGWPEGHLFPGGTWSRIQKCF